MIRISLVTGQVSNSLENYPKIHWELSRNFQTFFLLGNILHIFPDAFKFSENAIWLSNDLLVLVVRSLSLLQT